MKKDKLIAYDLGTGGIKASLFDMHGNSLAESFKQYDTFFPHERFVEQRPSDWWNGVCEATRFLLDKSGTSPDEIACAALSGHSLVAVPVSIDGEILLNQVPIWCDMRSEDEVPDFFKNLTFEDWYSTTGNGDPESTYTIFKLMWMKKHLPEVFSRTAKILGSKDYINYMFTGKIATDPSYASGFGVFNLKNWWYEDRFFEAAGISKSIFPDIIASDAIVGYVTKKASIACGLAEGTPVACGAVDNTCMATGALGLKEDAAYTSLGSSSWIALNSKTPIIDLKTRPFVFAHVKKGYYTSAVSIFSAGNSFRWIRDRLLDEKATSPNAYDILNKMAAASPVGSNGVIFNPSLSGGSSQEPGENLYGSFANLRLETTRDDIVRATMEGIALSLRCTLDILSSQVNVSGDMLLCGGGSKSPLWRQIFADIYNMPILKTNIDQDTASLGAAAMAANAVGLWNGYDTIANIHKKEDYTLPNHANNDYFEKLLPIYKKWLVSLSELGDSIKQL